jgi:hypothetical protein
LEDCSDEERIHASERQVNGDVHNVTYGAEQILDVTFAQ